MQLKGFVKIENIRALCAVWLGSRRFLFISLQFESLPRLDPKPLTSYEKSNDYSGRNDGVEVDMNGDIFNDAASSMMNEAVMCVALRMQTEPCGLILFF